ncbi:MAG: MogA/MoaB family molybdenum cofactor biosynthesis protein [Planctomycetota bacterium]|nr:MogA/MoaB family molybdenum cofactor biosynthesis protein [Planctomycetota bacterium]
MSIETSLIVVSDRASTGAREDGTAEQLRPVLAAAGFALVDVLVVPDERDAIGGAIRTAAERTPLVLTTGGTGISDRDVTPEATRAVLDFEIPGLGEAMRAGSLALTIHAVGSRATAGALGRAIVVNLPGRPKGAVECFGFVAKALPHLVAVRRGPVEDASHGTQDA